MARQKKAQYFKLMTFVNATGTQSWRVTGTKPDGTRIRQNFTDKSEAILRLAELETETEGRVETTRSQRTRLSAGELADAEAANLAAGGRSVAAIVSQFLGLESRARSKEIDLPTALAFAESHYRQESKAVSIFSARQEFVDVGTFGSPRTKQYYHACLKLLLRSDPNKAVHSFTVSDIEAILARYKNLNTKSTYRRAFSVFFNWAVRHHYCMENPCQRLDKYPKDMSKIEALSLEESKRLLYAAMKYQGGTAAATIAIGLFAGLRPSEIEDLKPDDILKDKIRVSGGKLRRKLKRTTPIAPVLAAWLKEYPFKGLPVGWDYKLKSLKNAVKAKKCVSDIIRHTSLSFQAERDKDEARTAFDNGTSVQMLNQHYRHTIEDEEVVAEFWNLTPENIRAADLDVEFPQRKRVRWPANARLKKLVWQKALIHVAADLGVSDVALKKHCVKLGIDLPPRGHWIR